MDATKLNEIKSKVYVYHIKPFDSLGIYIAESKDDTLKSINEELWKNVDWERMQNPSDEERAAKLRMNGMSEDHIDYFIVNNPHIPINIFNSIEVWTWEEYQEEQGFKISDRLLEITA